MRLFLGCTLVAALGCGGDDPPANPTWFGDVQEILIDNCVRCHGQPAANFAPTYFRLDRYVAGDGDGAAGEKRALSDAFDMSSAIVTRAVNFEEVGLSQMPPDADISGRQKDILARWLEQGAPKGTRDNTVPTAQLIQPSTQPAAVDQELLLGLRSEDADRDGLIVAIGYRPAGSGDLPIIFADDLPGGMVDVRLDTGVMASEQRFDIIAVLDDGYSDNPADNKTQVVLMADLLVDHGDRGTAPTVVLDAPNGGEALLGESAILWTATDPDAGDVLTIDLDLLIVDAAGAEISSSPIATGLANSSGFTWDPSAIASVDASGSPIAYKIRVSASDTGDQNTRSDDSDASFTLVGASGTTEYTWEDDIKPILVQYCAECHAASPINPNVSYFRLDKYDSADAGVGLFGVVEVLGKVYERLITAGTMPPANKSQLGATEIAIVKEWIEAGAPFGGGTGNGKPTFTWISPNDSATTITNSAEVTIQWSVTDPEGMPLTGSVVMAEISAVGNPMIVNCPSTLTGTTEVVASANISDGSAVVTLPNTGKFCFEGSVTDAAAQTSTAISAFGIKF